MSSISAEQRLRLIADMKRKLSELTSIVESWEMEGFVIDGVLHDENSLIREQHVADYLDVTRKMLYRLRIAGKLAFTRVGVSPMYRIKDIRDMLSNGHLPNTEKTIEDVILGHIKYATKRSRTKANK